MNRPAATPPDHLILRRAAEWFATLASESTTEHELAAWRVWLEQHPDHKAAWQYVDWVGSRFQQAQARAGRRGTHKILQAARTDRVTRRAMLGGGLSCLAFGLGWRFTPLGNYTGYIAHRLTADHSTAVGEIRRISLADGGQVWLNSDSALDILYQSSHRILKLHRGEVLVQTAEDPHGRPFLVRTAEGNMQALGTRFSVHQQQDATLVNVFEGAVKITTNRNAQHIIDAGRQARFSAETIHQPQSSQSAREAWTKGLIVADNILLKDLVAELARYSHGYIGVDKTVENIRVIGTYPADRPDHALGMLEDALPVKVRRILPWWVALEPK